MCAARMWLRLGLRLSLTIYYIIYMYLKLLGDAGCGGCCVSGGCCWLLMEYIFSYNRVLKDRWAALRIV